MSASHLFNQTLASAQSLGNSFAVQSTQIGRQMGQTIANSSITIGKSFGETVVTHTQGPEEHFVGSYHVSVKQRLAEGKISFVFVIWDDFDFTNTA